MTEQPIAFAVENAMIRGILHLPALESPSTRTSILFLHGWSGCRIGPHRMFVKTARRMCEAGYACLRFDFRGRGESDGETKDGSIQNMISDTTCAIDYMRKQTPDNKILLLGICSGCKVAIGAAVRSSAPSALVLWSPEPMGWLRNSSLNRQKSAFALRQYLRKLMHPATWRKILTCRVNTRLVGKALFQHESASALEIRAESELLSQFQTFGGKILCMYGTNDPDTAISMPGYADFCSKHGIPHNHHLVQDASHSYYSLAFEDEVISITEQWINGL
ncbi:MAG: alpha/beta fold hydrolase [Lentisphaerae bacterium]|nr:alpha/beta fold hydrolase [Lentisphaerota bacterium]